MKNLILIGICLVLFCCLKPDEIYAQSKDELKESYATAEDIMLQIIKPDVKQILREKYGKDFVSWNYDNKEIVDLKLVHKQLEQKWFEVTVSVVYKFKNTDGQANISLKVVPPAFSRDKKITEVELLDY